MDLSNLKTEIFSEINDIPRVATAEKASNGSDLIHKVNGLVDVVQSLVFGDDVWHDRSFYLDTAVNEDSGSGITIESPANTVARIIEIISSKPVMGSISIIISGTVENAFDFASVRFIGIPKIFLRNNANSNNDCRFVTEDDFNAKLIKNYPYGCQLKIENLQIDCRNTLNFENINLLTLRNCNFTTSFSHTEVFASISNVNFLSAINIGFTSSTPNSGTTPILNMRNVNFGKLEYLNFNTEGSRAIGINQSQIYIAGNNTFSHRSDENTIGKARESIVNFINQSDETRNNLESEASRYFSYTVRVQLF